MTETHRPLNILILGGSGFVSGTTARLALERGDHVWTLTRGRKPLPEGVASLTVDRRAKPDEFRQLVRNAGVQFDVVFDIMARQPEDTLQDVETFRDIAPHLVFVSTDSVYDPFHRSFPQVEAAQSYYAKNYGGRKRRCELNLIEGDTGDMKWTIVRPTHAYGPGSLLGCIPLEGRVPDLIDRIRRGDALTLVGGGHFLQQPVFCPDLARMLLSCCGNSKCHNRIFNAAGPDVIESRTFYTVIGEILGCKVRIAEYPVDRFHAEDPDKETFLCHRFFDMTQARAAGLAIPSTPLREGLRIHIESLIGDASD
ncbi:NAD-dependent epimerase/dehydratase family protein [Candidatus Sumerlaeota bacterium]|nr:NAD-dependent epimerase/dehydratase family protein [Candidatus Sumerlaeota bacterium]